MKKENLLHIKKPIEIDFERYFEINSNPENNLFNPAGAMSYEKAKRSFEIILEHWNENKFGVWAISEMHNPNYVIGFGGINYKHFNDEIKLNLGYRIDKEFWGRGYATELANSAIDFAFNELNINEIYALVRPTNLASIKVLEKCGLQFFDYLNDVPDKEYSLLYKIIN